MPEVTVLITTRNRREELRRALASTREQTCAAEVIVIDDACTDGTADLVEREFPEVVLHRSTSPSGLIVQRNRGVALAAAPIVVIIDDDAALQSPLTLEQTLRDFDDPRVGAVAIPHVDVTLRSTPRVSAPAHDGIFLTSEFTGTATAVRRDVFGAVGGFRESFFHQGEERDFCLRMLEAGWVVRVGRADPIHHYSSPARDLRRMDLYGRRNAVLCAWYNEPLPDALVRIAEMSAVGISSGIRVGRPLNALRGLALGYRDCWRDRGARRPVRRGVSRAFTRLRKDGPLPLAEVELLLASR
jgi:glycosyltransferase involved in cell wall biosynthesis